MSAGTKDAGFMRHTLAIVSAFLDYLKARLQLAGLEAKEASVHYLIIIALLIGALVVVVFGYFFVCLAVIFLIAWLCGEGALVWATFGMAVLHFAAAAAAAYFAKVKFADSMFTVTFDEFKKDQEWLNSQTAKQL